MPNQSAYVFGTSTGGTAVLDLTIRYPDLVHTAILHEPIVFSVIRDDALRNDMITLYQTVVTIQDPVEAYALFADYMFKPPQLSFPSGFASGKRRIAPSFQADRQPPDPVEAYNSRQGHQEAVAMVKYVVDENKVKEVANKLVVVCGMQSIDQRISEPGKALARLLGGRGTPHLLPGDHLNFTSRSRAPSFGEQLLRLLHERRRFDCMKRWCRSRL